MNYHATPEPTHCNIVLEQELLGAILTPVGAAVLNAIDRIITPDDFFDPNHQKLFASFLEAHGQGRPINLTLAIASLGPHAGFQIADDCTVGQYVARLAAAAAVPAAAPEYARQIRELAKHRQLNECFEILRAGQNANQSPSEIAGEVINLLDEIISASSTSATEQLSIGDAAYQAAEQMTIARQNPGRLMGISTGLRDLDARTGGLQPGNLIIVAGRPGMGKSAVAASIARHMAGSGNAVLFHSLEMSGRELGSRIIADICFDDGGQQIAYFDITSDRLNDADAQRVVDASRLLREIPLLIDPQSALTVAQIAARSRKYQQRLERQGKQLGAIFVDHLQLVRAGNRYSGNRVHEITEISGGLKSLAKELGVPVVVLAQLNRAVESRDNKRPALADLRDSGSIEQDADVVMFVFREEYYLQRETGGSQQEEDARIGRLVEVRNRLEIDICKQRSGPVGVVNLDCHIAANALRDAARSLR